MNDLILEIDGMLWLAVIAFAILAVVLFLLVEENDVKTEQAIMPDEVVPATPDARPNEHKPIKTPGKTIGVPVDTAMSEYQSVKLQSCTREIEVLERLKLIKGSQVEREQIQEQTIQEQPEIEQEHGDKKRGPWGY